MESGLGADQQTGRPADMEQICPTLNGISAVPEWGREGQQGGSLTY